MFRFSLSRFVPENRMWTQKHMLFEMGWTWVTRSTWDFSETTFDGNSNLNWKVCFLVRSPRKHCCEFFGRAISEPSPKSPFSGMKTLEDCTWLFLWFFRNGQKLCDHKVNDREKGGNDLPFAVRKRCPSPTSGTTLLCQRRVALNLGTHADVARSRTIEPANLTRHSIRLQRRMKADTFRIKRQTKRRSPFFTYQVPKCFSASSDQNPMTSRRGCA